MIKKELELYIHIPFCVKKCAYCDFLSGPADAGERAAYVDALIREIALRGEYYKEYCVKTIFLGGGTPSVLEGADTARIFRALREHFQIDGGCEITMEVNPGTVTEEKAEIWKAGGINRISIGLQSVNDDELKMLGRIHTFREFLHTWEILRKAGFENMNIDLISAIPGQTKESWERTLRTVAGLEPEHISAYSLIVEEGTPFYDRYGAEAVEEDTQVVPLPDEDTERAIYQATERILEEYGYRRYEISNYARDGYECRHNLGYWERKEYLGLGLGAASLIGERRFHNTDDAVKYKALFMRSVGASEERSADSRPEEEELREETEILSVQDQMEEFMFLGLRKADGISEQEFRANFGKEIGEVYGEQIWRLTGLGLLERCESRGRLRLTQRGVDVSNYVFAEFLF